MKIKSLLLSCRTSLLSAPFPCFRGSTWCVSILWTAPVTSTVWLPSAPYLPSTNGSVQESLHETDPRQSQQTGCVVCSYSLFFYMIIAHSKSFKLQPKVELHASHTRRGQCHVAHEYLQHEGTVTPHRHQGAPSQFRSLCSELVHF